MRQIAYAIVLIVVNLISFVAATPFQVMTVVVLLHTMRPLTSLRSLRAVALAPRATRAVALLLSAFTLLGSTCSVLV
jgi:hypothetical protein